MTIELTQKFKYLENEKSFHHEIRTLFIIFKRLSLKQIKKSCRKVRAHSKLIIAKTKLITHISLSKTQMIFFTRNVKGKFVGLYTSCQVFVVKKEQFSILAKLCILRLPLFFICLK